MKLQKIFLSILFLFVSVICFSQTTNYRNKTASQIGGIVEGVTIPDKAFYDNQIFATVVAWINRVESDQYNAKDFGAVGDGSIQDVSAIQTLIDTAATQGVAFIPQGTYLFDDSLRVPGYSHIRGAGMGLTIIKRDSAVNIDSGGSRSWLIANKNASNDSFIVIEDLTIDLNGGVGDAKKAIAITFENAKKVIVRNVEIKGLYHPQALRAEGCTDVWFMENYVHDTQDPSGLDASGIVAVNSTNVFIYSNKINDINDSPLGANDSHNVNIINNICIDFGQFGFGSQDTDNLTVIGNYFEGEYATWKDSSSYGMVGINISDDNILQPNTYGYLIKGNIIKDVRTPIRFKSLSTTEYYGVVIKDNIGYDITLDDEPDLSGLIWLDATVADSNIAIVEGNTFFDLNKPYSDSTNYFRLFNLKIADVVQFNNNRVYIGNGTLNDGGIGCDGRLISFQGVDANSRIDIANNYIDIPDNDDDIINITNGTAYLWSGNFFGRDSAGYQGTVRFMAPTGESNSIPADGKYHAVGEIWLNNTPTAGSNVGWICTTAGIGGTWQEYGIVEGGNIEITSPQTTITSSGSGTKLIVKNTNALGNEVHLDLTSLNKTMRLWFRDSDDDFGIYDGSITKLRIDGATGNFDFNDGVANLNSGINVNSGGVVTKIITASTSWDPGSLANGASISTSIGVSGVTQGATIAVSLSTITNAAWQLSAFAPSAGSITVSLTNHTGGTVDLANGTLRFTIFEH